MNLPVLVRTVKWSSLAAVKAGRRSRRVDRIMVNDALMRKLGRVVACLYVSGVPTFVKTDSPASEHSV